MSHVTVGKWGKNLAVRIPFEISRIAGLTDGEQVEIETQDGNIVIRRTAAKARMRTEAEAAAADIIGESKRYSLGGVSIRDLLEDGRRG
jgi:antitoxin MazE